MTICDKINTAGNTLQSKLNERGVSCTYGKNSDNKQTITDMANLITSDNLKGANDAILNIYANRPYLMDGETTDIIATLHDGLGNPLANKEITITADIEDEVMDNIFTSSTWNNNIYNSQEGIMNTSSPYTYMTKEFTGLNNYTLSFMLNSLESGAELRFGDTISGTASNYLKFKFANSIMTISKVVNNVETTVYTYTFGQQNFIQFVSSPHTITRSGDTFTFFGQTITMSGLKNTIGLVGTIGFYEGDFTVASLYTGITNKNGQFLLPNVSITSDTIFTATYQGLSSNVLLENCVFVDYCLTNNHNSNWTFDNSYGSMQVTDTGRSFIATNYNNIWRFNAKPNLNNYYFTYPISITFEVVDFVAAPALFVNVTSDSTNKFLDLTTSNCQKGDIITVTIGYTGARWSINGVSQKTVNYSTASQFQLAISAYKTISSTFPNPIKLKIRDFRIKRL